MAIRNCVIVIVLPVLCVGMILLQVAAAAVANDEAASSSDEPIKAEKRMQDKINRTTGLVAEARNSADILSLLLYDRWNRESSTNYHRESIRDNELIGAGPDHHQQDKQLDQKESHRSQQDYVCGRAVANKKYKDILMRDTNYQMSVARTKYRPIEIRMPRIIGGDDTSPGEFPWTVSIKLNGQPICGGSLIDRNWILTAAHCVVGYNPKNLTVRLGAYRIKDSSESQTIDLPVSMFVVHKDYSMPRPFSNDIAMLKLIETVDYSDYIIPICLPTEDQLTTSETGSVPLNDYSNNHRESSSSSSSSSSNKMSGGGEDIGGIVISTKMSDHEIAKCFNRLEQNYLSSIGLGAIVAEVATSTGGSTENQQQPDHAATSSSPPIKQATGGPEVLMSEPLPIRESSSSSSSSSNNNNNQGGSKISFQLKPVGAGSSQTLSLSPGGKPANTIDHLHHHQHHFELPPSTLDLSQVNPLDYGYDDSYFGSPWNSRARHHPRQPTTASSNSEVARREPLQAVKLSRLPISKELLREIQSIGSAQMPSLDLGPPHAATSDTLLAVASDLNNQHQTHNTAGHHNEPPAANNRGRYKTNNLHHQQQQHSNIVRTIAGNDIENDDDLIVSTVDDPTKYSGLSGTVVGWGWVRELDGDDQVTNNKGYPSVTLQKVKLPILRNHVCEAWFQSQSKKITLLPSQFCAGFNSGGKDACRGDSGGPMIIEDSSDTGRYKLIGIVSAGIGCARPSLPGLYTRVASFLPWINAQMNRY